jgi:hypothetical protein
VDVFRVGGQVGPAGRLCEPLDELWLQPDRLRDLGQGGVIPAVEVDPGQLPVIEAADEVVVEGDLAILPVGVVQADVRSADLPVEGAQRIAARRTATTIARPAMPYCRMSIAWSDRLVAGAAIRAVRPRKMGW